MSSHGRVGQSGLDVGESAYGPDITREAIRKSLAALLTIGTESHGRGGLSPVGLVHSVGVGLLEMRIMARGTKKAAEDTSRVGMPRFVDVKLTREDRAAFLQENDDPAVLVQRLQILCDHGYRVGCSWSGETQSYTVSLTCRNPESANDGLCMTSFAGELVTAVRLALFKHEFVTAGLWLGDATTQTEQFG